MKIPRMLPTLLLPLFFVGCAGSGVVQTGPNTYVVSRTSAAGMFADMSKLKAETIQEANEFAANRGAIAEGISLEEERPQQGFPNVEYQFRLVGRGGGTALPSDVRQIQIR